MRGMVSYHSPGRASFEYWSAWLLLAAGVLFVGHAVVRGIEAFTTIPPPVDVFGPTGYVAALLGLLGLYPALADRTPRISRIAAGTAVLLVPLWILIAVWNYGDAAGIFPPQSALIPEAIFFVIIASTLLLYLLFGVSSLRAESHTRALGILLLTPAALLLLLVIGGGLLSLAPEAGGALIGSGLAITHAALGGELLIGRTKGNHVEQSANIAME